MSNPVLSSDSTCPESISNSSVKSLAKRLESALGGALPGGPRPNFSVNVPAEAPRKKFDVVIPSSDGPNTHDNSGNQSVIVSDTNSNTSTQYFITQKVDEIRVKQSIDTLSRLLADGVEEHHKLKAKSSKSKYNKIMGGFSAKLAEDEVFLGRIDGFWGKFKAVLESSYPKLMTYGSMLGTVLIAIVEARQVLLDIHEFGRKNSESSKTIVKAPLVANLLETLVKLEHELDEVLFFVGHSLAQDMNNRTFSANRHKNLEEEVAVKPVITLPAIVEAPLMLLKDRIENADIESLAKLLPDIKRIEKSAKSFHNQGYDDVVVLLFIAETIGKTAWEVANKDETLRKKVSESIHQVLSTARVNAWSLLKQSSSLDLSLKLRMLPSV